jgi:hypothetical protein
VTLADTDTLLQSKFNAIPIPPNAQPTVGTGVNTNKHRIGREREEKRRGEKLRVERRVKNYSPVMLFIIADKSMTVWDQETDECWEMWETSNDNAVDDGWVGAKASAGVLGQGFGRVLAP